MVSIICNSGINFFQHYIKTFNNFQVIEVERFFLNKNLKTTSDKTFITTTSPQSFSLKDIFNFKKYYEFNKMVKNSHSKTYHFISVHPINCIQILILKLQGKRIISTIHDLTPHPDWKSQIINNIQKWIIARSDKVVLHNNKDVKEITKSTSIPLSGYELKPVKKVFNRTLLFFGRIEPYKGLGNLIQMLESNSYIRANWNIIIAGKGNIPKEVSNFHNIKIINRFVSDEDLEILHSQAAFTILPYDSATQSAVITHSLSLGTPVIAYNVGALSEYTHDWNGYLVEHNDFLQIQKILENYNEELMRFFQKSIISNYSAFFSQKKIESEYLKLYQ